MKIHPHSVNCKLHANGANGVAARDGPTLVCYDDVTRGESQMYVRECTTVAAPALVLVTGNLAVEPLPPCEMPDHDESDPAAVREAAQMQRDAQARQDASQCAVLVCDDWLRFRVPLAVLSQIACLRIRLAKAFAAKTQRPHDALAPDLADALAAVATVLAHDGGGGGGRPRRRRARRGRVRPRLRRRRRRRRVTAAAAATATGGAPAGAAWCSRRSPRVSGAAFRRARPRREAGGEAGNEGAGAGRRRGRGVPGPRPPGQRGGGGGGGGGGRAAGTIATGDAAYLARSREIILFV